MKNVKDLVGKASRELSSTTGGQPPEPPVIDERTIRIVNALFRELMSIYPAWKQAWPDDAAVDAAKKTWIKSFLENQIGTMEQIRLGVQACRRSAEPWIPSAGQFIDMCKPSAHDLGIPDLETSWVEACNASAHPDSWFFTHAIVQEAGRLTSWYNIRGAVPTAEKCRKVFEGHYIDLMHRIRSGHQIIDGQLLIGQERALSATEAAETQAEEELKQRIKAQGLHTKTPAQLRAEMLEKLGIKR